MMRRALPAAVVGLLAALGGYVLIYLFRWEWHRAIVTALFFIAAEIGLGMSFLLRRLRRVEQRLDEVLRRSDAAMDAAVLARIHEAAPPGRAPFAWLDPREQRLSVFLPFLLGLGALASGLAWVVEQFARHTTTPLLERRLATRLAPFALPAGGLLGDGRPGGDTPRRRSAREWVPIVAALVVVVTLTAAAIDWLGDELQTRPSARQAQVSTRIEVELRGVLSTARPEQAAATLWGACRHVLRGNVGEASIRQLGPVRFEVLVPKHIGRSTEQHLRGCLQDIVVDRVQATVVALELVPTA